MIRQMVSGEVRLRINPGGTLTPAEIVGRDRFVTDTWEALERQSVLLTAERRMGKTSVLLKLEADPVGVALVVKRSLQGIRSPEEFVATLVGDVEQANPGLLKTSIGSRLAELGITKIGSSALSVEFKPNDTGGWKHVAAETFAALDREVDGLVVLLWDELPQMVSDINDSNGPEQAREVLDVLRQVRESHPSLRMVLSGSLGIHHVVAKLRAQGGMWVPTHDMRSVDLPPLAAVDAGFLATELLRNEKIQCDDLEAVATAIAGEADCIPYYVHQIALHLREAQRREGAAIDVETVERVVAAAIADPLDPWELGHYVDRTPIYYRDEADQVNAVLDLVAVADRPLPAAVIHERLGAFGKPPSPERLQALLELLCKDYYLGRLPEYGFLRSLVRRAWLAKRPPR